RRQRRRDGGRRRPDLYPGRGRHLLRTGLFAGDLEEPFGRQAHIPLPGRRVAPASQAGRVRTKVTPRAGLRPSPPLKGGNTSGPAKPVPRCSWNQTPLSDIDIDVHFALSTYLFPPPAVQSLAIRGKTEQFPIHRLFFVGRNYHAHAVEMGKPVDKS